MNRVQLAIRQGRCVLAVGTRALAQPAVQAELRRRRIAVVALGADAPPPACPVSVESLRPVTSEPGGLLVLVEPEPAVDGRGLAEVARLVAAAAQSPGLVVASRAFNPFGLPMDLRRVPMDRLKVDAVDFLSSLPVEERVELAAPPPVDRVDDALP